MNALIDLSACPAQVLNREWVSEQAVALEAEGFTSIKVKVCTPAISLCIQLCIHEFSCLVLMRFLFQSRHLCS